MPGEIGGRRGSSEVYRAENIELRAGDRIRWTKGPSCTYNQTGSLIGGRPGP